jgi:hypothetical protein
MRLKNAMLLPVMMAISACGGSAQAETVSIKCEASQGWQAPAMTMVYEGADTGTLTLKSEFGEMSLPATKEHREAVGDDGEKQSATGIRATGPAKVLMPDKAAAEACAKGKLTPEQSQDSDIVFTTILGCLGQVAMGQAPIDIKASAEIAIVEPPSVSVGLKRIYLEPSTLPGGEPIAVEAYPNCTLVQ